MRLYNEFLEQGTKLANEEADVLRRNDELTRRLAEVKALRAQEEPAAQALQHECEELETKVKDHNETQAKMRAASQALKAQTEEAKNKISEVAFQIETLKDELKKARAQIVESPERVRSELAAMEHKLEDEKAALDEVQRSSRDILGRLHVAGKAEKEVDTMLGLLGDARVEHEHFLAASEAVGAEQGTLATQTSDSVATENERNRLEKEKIKEQEKLLAVRQSFMEKQAAAQRALEGLKAETDRLQTEGMEAEAKATAGNSRRADLEAQMVAVQEEHAQQM